MGEGMTRRVRHANSADLYRPTSGKPRTLEAVHVIDVAWRRLHSVRDLDDPRTLGEDRSGTHAKLRGAERPRGPRRSPRYKVAKPDL